MKNILNTSIKQDIPLQNTYLGLSQITFVLYSRYITRAQNKRLYEGYTNIVDKKLL